MTKDEALRLALDWFKCYQDKSMSRNNAEELANELITAIKAALEAKDEPVAYPEDDVVGPCICGSWPGGKCLKCPRITPPQRKPLTDKEIQEIFIANSLVVDNGNAYMVAGLRTVNIAQAIEAKLKEKTHD